MIISKTQVQNLLKTYAKTTTDNINKSKEVKQKFSQKDELAISGESKIKQQALLAVKQAEDIRIDQVNNIKEQMSAGTYEISDDEVAEKMISRAIVDKMA